MKRQNQNDTKQKTKNNQTTGPTTECGYDHTTLLQDDRVEQNDSYDYHFTSSTAA